MDKIGNKVSVDKLRTERMLVIRRAIRYEGH